MDKIKANNDPKLQWIRPELRKLEAGEAESQRATTPDGSGQQAS